MNAPQGNLIDMYSGLKEEGAADKTEYVNLLLINGTPALRVRVNDPVTGKYIQDVEMGVDVGALKKQRDALAAQLANLDALIADAEKLTKE